MTRFSVVVLLTALVGVLVYYLALRTRSHATPISFSGGTCCSYALSLRVFATNVLEYVRRTYALLALLGGALGIWRVARGRRMSVRQLCVLDGLLSVMLFAAMVSPFILLREVSAVYSYLPGIGASLLLGTFVRSFDETPSQAPSRFAPVGLVPLLLVVVFCIASTVKLGSKWIQLAETNSVVLRQIAAQQPTVPPDTFILLTYSKIDYAHRFPEGFGSWCFPYAIRVLYGDRSLDGAIVKDREPYSTEGKSYEVRFSYVGSDSVLVLRTSEPSTLIDQH